MVFAARTVGQLRHKKGSRSLNFAVSGGCVASIHALLKAGADPNGRTRGVVTR